MHNQGLDMKEISKLTGYSTSRILKYLSEDYNVFNSHYGVSRAGLLEPYRNEVIKKYPMIGSLLEILSEFKYILSKRNRQNLQIV